MDCGGRGRKGSQSSRKHRLGRPRTSTCSGGQAGPRRLLPVQRVATRSHSWVALPSCSSQDLWPVSSTAAGRAPSPTPCPPTWYPPETHAHPPGPWPLSPPRRPPPAPPVLLPAPLPRSQQVPGPCDAPWSCQVPATPGAAVARLSNAQARGNLSRINIQNMPEVPSNPRLRPG